MSDELDVEALIQALTDEVTAQDVLIQQKVDTLIDNAKAGGTITAADLAKLKTFISDSKQKLLTKGQTIIDDNEGTPVPPAV